jgi:hypothetical protein
MLAQIWWSRQKTRNKLSFIYIVYTIYSLLFTVRAMWRSSFDILWKSPSITSTPCWHSNQGNQGPQVAQKDRLQQGFFVKDTRTRCRCQPWRPWVMCWHRRTEVTEGFLWITILGEICWAMFPVAVKYTIIRWRAVGFLLCSVDIQKSYSMLASISVSSLRRVSPPRACSCCIHACTLEFTIAFRRGKRDTSFFHYLLKPCSYIMSHCRLRNLLSSNGFAWDCVLSITQDLTGRLIY